MALAYPEGECFFQRSALSTSQSDGYHADNIQDFYSNIMVEYVWNQEAYHGSANAKSPRGRTHGPGRSGYKIVNGDWWNTDYGCWEQLPFSYGPTPNDIKRRFQHNLCTSGNRVRDREKGASAEAWFMTMPMPTKEERCVWIDLLGYVRAIYIPIAHQADEQYKHLCTFIQINFTQRGMAQIWRPQENKFVGHQCDKTYGLRVFQDHSVGLDVYGLLQLLALPRQLRQMNAYNAKFISLIPSSAIKTISLSPKGSRVDSYDFNWTKVAGANFGLEVQWTPHKPTTWFAEFMKNIITIGLGFVPGVGVILAVSFSLGWTALTDPDSFYEALKAQIPLVLLTDGIISELRKDAEATKKFLPPGWDQVGRGLQIPKSQIKGIVETPPDASLDGIGKSSSFEKADKVLAKSGPLNAPDPEE